VQAVDWGEGGRGRLGWERGDRVGEGGRGGIGWERGDRKGLGHMIFCKPAVHCTLLTKYFVTNTAIPIFVNLNIPRCIKHELRNMIKTCIVIRLTTIISIHVNPLNMYI